MMVRMMILMMMVMVAVRGKVKGYGPRVRVWVLVSAGERRERGRKMRTWGCFPLKNWFSWENLQKGVEERNYKYLFKIRKLQVDLLWDFWENVPVGVWSARDHFIPLTMQSIRWSKLPPNKMVENSSTSMQSTPAGVRITKVVVLGRGGTSYKYDPSILHQFQ